MDHPLRMDKVDQVDIPMEPMLSLSSPKGTLIPKLTKFREAVDLLFNDSSSSRAAFILSIYIMVLIVASTLAFCLGTIVSLSSSPLQMEIWFWLETFFIANFTLEFLIRLAVTPNQKVFWKTGMNWIDLLAILPYYIELVVDALSAEGVDISGLAAIRVVRLVRVFRLLKLGKQSQKLQQVMEAFSRSGEGVVLLLFLLSLSTIFFSSCMFFAETSICELQDGHWVYTSGPLVGQQTQFQSILHSFWWTIVTITTVGYGDAFPVSPGGKVVACFTIVGGLLTVAFPVTIIGANLNEIYEEYRTKREAEERKKLEDDLVAEFQKRIELSEVATRKFSELMGEIKGIKGEIDLNLGEIGQRVQKVKDLQEQMDALVTQAIKMKLLKMKTAAEVEKLRVSDAGKAPPGAVLERKLTHDLK